VAISDFLPTIISPKKKAKAGGTALTPTYNPQQSGNILTFPTYRDHLTDLFSNRQSADAQSIMEDLFQHDPDVSAAVNGYLTLADTQMIAWAEDLDGKIDPAASAQLYQLLNRISFQTDYTLGFQLKMGLDKVTEELRYMGLLRGAIGMEWVADKKGLPDSIRNVDMKSIRWYEKQPGVYKPGQVVAGQTNPVMLDYPSFFVSYYRRSPTSVYSSSPFVSAINTIAARQQVINDLYRIMRYTGYPRVEIKVLEDILVKAMPPLISQNKGSEAYMGWLQARYAEIQANFSTIAVDQAIVHADSLEFSILNEKNPGMALNVEPIIATFNAQNQAGLKSMSTVLGRGTQGVNTGSVEARLAALFADQLNEPIIDLYQRAFSYQMHQAGFQGFVKVRFAPAELRPWTELEPQLVLKAQRLRQDLSDGLITDVEYHLWMYERLPPDSAPELSGTQFMSAAPAEAGGSSGASTGTRPEDVSPNAGALNRAASPDRTAQTARNPAKRPAQNRSARLAALALEMSDLMGDDA
jgi:hypothetical protein